MGDLKRKSLTPRPVFSASTAQAISDQNAYKLAQQELAKLNQEIEYFNNEVTNISEKGAYEFYYTLKSDPATVSFQSQFLMYVRSAGYAVMRSAYSSKAFHINWRKK